MTGAPNMTGSSVLNPAIGFGTNLVMAMAGNDDPNDPHALINCGLDYFYVYLFMPLAGAVLAVIFHEFVYKPS